MVLKGHTKAKGPMQVEAQEGEAAHRGKGPAWVNFERGADQKKFRLLDLLANLSLLSHFQNDGATVEYSNFMLLELKSGSRIGVRGGPHRSIGGSLGLAPAMDRGTRFHPFRDQLKRCKNQKR